MDVVVRSKLWPLDLLALSAAAILAARATAHMADAQLLRISGDDAAEIAAAPPVLLAPPASHDVAAMVRRDIFCSACRRRARAQARPDERRPAAALPLRLLAVMVAARPSDARLSIAVIKDERGSAGAYAVGSPVASAVVEAIEDTRVLLRLPAGERQVLTLLDDVPPVGELPRGVTEDPLAAELEAGIEQRDETSYGVRRATIESLLAKMDAVAPQARVEPEVRDGKPVGFRLRDVKGDGVFAKLGLRDGDLIASVNGLATNGPDNALAIYASLRSVGHLSVGLERAGRRITTEYDIE